MKSWKELLLVLACCAALVVYFKPRLTPTPPPTQATEETPSNQSVLVTGELGKGKYRLVLVRLDQDAKLVQWSQEQIEEFTGAQVSRVVDISSEQMMSDCYNARRGQFDSDQISAFLDGMSHQPHERLLAVTRFDLYLS